MKADRHQPGKTEDVGPARLPIVSLTPGCSSGILMPREIECLEWLARGFDNQAIAGRLGIAAVTVALHLTNARTKLGAATREQALVLALGPHYRNHQLSDASDMYQELPVRPGGPWRRYAMALHTPPLRAGPDSALAGRARSVIRDLVARGLLRGKR